MHGPAQPPQIPRAARQDISFAASFQRRTEAKTRRFLCVFRGQRLSLLGYFGYFGLHHYRLLQLFDRRPRLCELALLRLDLAPLRLDLICQGLGFKDWGLR